MKAPLAPFSSQSASGSLWQIPLHGTDAGYRECMGHDQVEFAQAPMAGYRPDRRESSRVLLQSHRMRAMNYQTAELDEVSGYLILARYCGWHTAATQVVVQTNHFPKQRWVLMAAVDLSCLRATVSCAIENANLERTVALHES
jgi:hypothetical protein